MKRALWTLLAISVANGKTLSPVQVQKSLFLLGRMLPDEVGDLFQSFTPYNYGPFCLEIYQDAEKLSSKELITITRPLGQRQVEYRATPKGLELAKELQKEVPERALQYLNKVVKWARELSFQELVRVIYSIFPEFKRNSVFVD